MASTARRSTRKTTKTRNVPPTADEHLEQCALIDWHLLAQKKDPRLDLLFAIPNGGKRNKLVAVKLKREGVKPGVPDLMLPVPARGFHGLFIEMKRQVDGTVRKTQREWLDKLDAQGYHVVVCRGCDEAIDVLTWYLAN